VTIDCEMTESEHRATSFCAVEDVLTRAAPRHTGRELAGYYEPDNALNTSTTDLQLLPNL